MCIELVRSVKEAEYATVYTQVKDKFCMLKIILPTLFFRQWCTVKNGFWFLEILQLIKPSK